ncbi:MAG TPA: ABC transporter permease [Gemmatimonadaceae bacterium]|nr:ABC transporter permease [Gemmatimonadaceae bacterium]
MRSNPARGERLFRALLLLYPRSFRDRFMDEMLEFFRARCDEARKQRGAYGLARLWMHLVADIAVNAPLQHVRAFRSTSARELPWASPFYPEESHPMDVLRQDIRYALRSMARHPAFAIIAALTLALGIGANTAIFSVVDAVLLRPLPWPDPDRLVMVYGARGTQRQNSAVYLDYKDWRDQSNSFQELGVVRGQSVNLTGGENPDRLTGTFTTASTFRLLGASAFQGRLFTDAETEVSSKEPVAVITESLWRTRFGSRSDMLGRTMVLNGQPFTVVGIMRPDFQAPLFTPDVWMPIGYYPNKGDLETRGRAGVLVFGKLKENVGVARAQADLDAITERLADLYPTTNAGTSANVQPLKEQIVGQTRTPLLIVLVSVGIVLLIACANVANLQLARATARRRELSVRAALGAGRKRLMRQLLTESLALSVVGGLAGLGIAYLGVAWLSKVVPNILPFFGTIALDRGVLAFAAFVTLATGIVFGIAPAWQASRADMQEALTVRGDTGSAIRLRARSALVMGQLALCVVLVVSAVLLTRSLVALSAVKPGFDPEQLLTLQFRLPAVKYDADAKIVDMFDRTIEEIRAVPGVAHASLVRATPLNGNGETFPYEMEGSRGVEPDKLPSAHRNIVSTEYFETMNIPRLAGRDFTAEDRATSVTVVIVNTQLASKIAPQGSAIGKRLRLLDGDSAKWATVVGVVGNAKHFQLNETQLDQVYVPYSQKPLIFTEVVVRTNGNPMRVANAVRSAIWRVDPDQPVWRIRPVTQSIDLQLDGRRFTMRLLASFALLAVLLATIGVYGVMSYAVARRTQEMGIRMALGARNTQVVGMVLRQGLRTIGIALVIGLGASFGATRLLESQLFGVEATDPLTFAAVPVALALVGLAACYLPARRASRVDPVVALRAE